MLPTFRGFFIFLCCLTFRSRVAIWLPFFYLFFFVSFPKVGGCYIIILGVWVAHPPVWLTLINVRLLSLFLFWSCMRHSISSSSSGGVEFIPRLYLNLSLPRIYFFPPFFLSRTAPWGGKRRIFLLGVMSMNDSRSASLYSDMMSRAMTPFLLSGYMYIHTQPNIPHWRSRGWAGPLQRDGVLIVTQQQHNNPPTKKQVNSQLLALTQ
jgi:hypothetical protein